MRVPGPARRERMKGWRNAILCGQPLITTLPLSGGAVPIVYNNNLQIGDTTIQRNLLTDSWQFQINDLTWCVNNLPATPIQPARISKWSAEGMLARAYLARSGLTGNGRGNATRATWTARSIMPAMSANSGLTLEPNYYNLFTSANFSGSVVPQESLFSLLWIPDGQYFVQNHMQANLAYSAAITQTGDGWGRLLAVRPA
jgi:hypothetical protein